MNEEEIKALAVDIVEGKVFGSWSITEDNTDLIPIIFMPLGLGAEIPADIGHVYEYLTEAGERYINGYPSFFSMRMINKMDWIWVWKACGEYAKVKEQFLKAPDESLGTPI